MILALISVLSKCNIVIQLEDPKGLPLNREVPST